MTNDTTDRWVRDETGGGVVAGGQIGGDVQVTESFTVRFTQAEQPSQLVQYALVTYSYYGASDDVNDAGPPFHVELQTELMVCADPKDPGGTEIWCDYLYDTLDLGSFHLAETAEAAAKQAATEHLECDTDWSGMAPWQEAEESDGEPSEPDQEDGIIQFLRDRYSASLAASHLGDYETDHEARYWLALEMEATGFWPNAWTISDHGNAHLITLDKAIPLTTTDANPQPIIGAKLREQLPQGTKATVTYLDHGSAETVSGVVDWTAVDAEGFDDDERDETIAISVANGFGGEAYLIAWDDLRAVTIDPVTEQ